MDSILIAILIMNAVISIICAIRWKGGKESILNIFFFLMLPVLGLGIYFIPRFMLAINKNIGYDRDSLVKRIDTEHVPQMPVVREELNTIAVGDAMAVSNNTEKRQLMLKQLKKDETDNYKLVLDAGKDEDSETAHYVAAAKMEAYRNKFVEILKIKNKISEDNADPEMVVELLEKMELYIDSELLAEKEALMYKNEYCQLFSKADDFVKRQFTIREYTKYISYLVDMDQYDKVQEFWNPEDEKMACEDNFMRMMEIHYRHKNKEKFYTCMEQLKKSKIVLSSNGLETIRFWENRRV